MTEDQERFIEKINDLKELYVEVKEAIILAENFDPSHDVYLSPLNELRNSFDHIMRSLIYVDKANIEFDEAKEHLYRAGYDAYEVLAINVGESIIKNIERYDAEVISAVFPKYYTDVKPHLVDIKVELADARAHKRLNPDTGTKSFTPYKERITNLIKQLKVCNEQIPALMREKNKRKGKRILEYFIGALLGIAITIMGLWLYDKYFKSSAEPPQNRTHSALGSQLQLSSKKTARAAITRDAIEIRKLHFARSSTRPKCSNWSLASAV